MSQWKEIGVEKAKEKMDSENLIIIDIRDPESYEASHIPDAVNLNGSNIKEFVEGCDKTKPLIICCYHGISSQGAADYFSQLGFAEVYSLAGGFESWSYQYPCEP